MTFPVTEHFFETRRTARYFTAGNMETATEVLYVLHGYGLSAERMLQKIAPAVPGAFVIAPEGLSRYYNEGYNGRVGASWMTKEAREKEISDYVHYLDGLHKQLFPILNIPLTILGFSQGASTAARWTALGEVKPQRLILWGGKLPPDLPDEVALQMLKQTQLHYIIGTHDQFVTPEIVQRERERLETLQVPFLLFEYEGKHKIETPVLASFLKKKPLRTDIKI